MEETLVQDHPGIVNKIVSLFRKENIVDDELEYAPVENRANAAEARPSYRYTVTVRRQIVSFEDAMAAANGLKRGEQQILNLVNTDLVTRQKIVDFMSGVNYAQEGTWEELGENVYLVAPAHAFVEIAPASSTRR
ncbi:cell division protein SepF [bacterium]|nr:MAG: cell division protein SepF [bacterium]